MSDGSVDEPDDSDSGLRSTDGRAVIDVVFVVDVVFVDDVVFVVVVVVTVVVVVNVVVFIRRQKSRSAFFLTQEKKRKLPSETKKKTPTIRFSWS